VATARQRLDAELVRRGLAPSRERARAQIEEGSVTVGGAPALKPARLVAPDEPIEVAGPPPRFVSRGGDKLDAALDHFGVAVDGARVLDAGASTGGFTDCVLQRGASQVVAVDVGHGQIHERLRHHPQVDVRERTNVRGLTLDDVGEPVDVVVADLSFISLTSVIAALLAVSRPGADLVVLVKPQFEAGHQEASRGRGVIRDPEVWARALHTVIDAFGSAGATIMGLMVSPLRGASGNVEFLLHARHAVADERSDAAGDEPSRAVDVDRVVADAAAGRAD
jgi:23S rRNA (cytidine1920-2'-O)/16S rRNA (cytidine1409-2'-O)-methyltransferase